MTHDTLTPGSTYHIYNRGNNGDITFPEPRNYEFFLRLMERHLLSSADIYAYCLMKNHFHFVLRVKDESDLPEKFRKRPFQAFSNMFNAYAKAINKSTGRTGSLFEKNYERKLISDEEYLRRIILYVHCNPVHHKVCTYFRDYSYSSIHEYLKGKKMLISDSLPLQLFDSLENFIALHEHFQVNHSGFKNLNPG